ncbi:S49 family peptidase [Wohlfahrtiimonas chitiniclastica]|uniref:S49 family peptidase n=1 Tax=Wohlfahrtiimonas chitiniclastica TaxID=400946 RepID=UPI001BD04742|nr:S49 family peptidase [Wohlfahrtiimonas chitiniclastica]MBS7829006.1 S49 family peptidase [Wohlfahrtiimonas chitiniclastica]
MSEMKDSALNQQLYSVLEKTLQAGVIEQRRKRRWGIFFKILFAIYFFFVIALITAGPMLADQQKYLDDNGEPLTAYTAVIRIEGEIAASTDASADQIISALKKAFNDPKATAIVLRINSGGGSPVQSGYVYDEINRLKALHSKKVYAVIMDIGASGAYYIASAADEIYADRASLVGSIGVTAASFGFVDAMHKLGVERRLYTSGEHKAFLDPFSPQNASETDFWKNVLNTVHLQFIDAVKKGRGDRLQNNPELFSGLIWSGEQALPLGLIDGLGSTSSLARDVIKAPALVDFTVEETGLSRFMKKIGTQALTGLFTSANTVQLR